MSGGIIFYALDIPFIFNYYGCREVVSSPALYSGRTIQDFDREPGYPDRSFRGFPQSFQRNSGIYILIGPEYFFPYQYFGW